MSARIMICRFVFVACVVLGVACANLIGIDGFWWKAGASDREVWRKYAEDATDWNAKPEEFRKVAFFFEYSDVKQSRVHGLPFRFLWCDVMAPGRLDRVRATPWLFDGASVFELRVWPLLADITVAMGIIASTYWAAQHYLRKAKWQFTLASLPTWNRARSRAGPVDVAAASAIRVRRGGDFPLLRCRQGVAGVVWLVLCHCHHIPRFELRRLGCTAYR
jgi:hypothetical protein